MVKILKKIFNLFKKDKVIISKKEYIIDLLGFDSIEMGLVSKDFFDVNQTKLSEFLAVDVNGSCN